MGKDQQGIHPAKPMNRRIQASTMWINLRALEESYESCIPLGA